MKAVDFGRRSGLKVAPASIGAMRLPRDMDEAVALLRHAIDSGMRYIDTSRGYGDSEIKVGRALKDGYREKVILSTKCSPWITKIDPDDEPTADCTRKRIEESMKRLDVDYLDFYQVWNIETPEHYEMAIAKGGMVDGIRKAMDEGLVRHTGFTSHDSPEHLERYFEEADWAEVVLLSYHLFNRRFAPALAKAREKGIGTIVMNPVAGGKLGEDSKVFDVKVRATGCRSLADLAIRYVLANPDVDTLLCGMTCRRDVDSTVAAAKTGGLEPKIAKEAAAFTDSLTKENMLYCTSCGYCMPCPQGVEIPKVLDAIHNYRTLGFEESARRQYAHLDGKSAEACNACGMCVVRCTQGIDVIAEMDYARETLGTE